VVRPLANCALPVVMLGATSHAHEPSAFVEPSPSSPRKGQRNGGWATVWTK
jgi:hypothetical protein